MILYYLGFPYNRRTFYEMAVLHPLADWGEPGLLECICEEWRGRVNWQLGRPLNRARRRLDQYCLLNQVQPDWVSRLSQGVIGEQMANLIDTPMSTPDARRQLCMPQWRHWLAQDVLAGIMGRSLPDRLWLDVFLPFMGVAGVLEPERAFSLWFHGYPAVAPDRYRDPLKRIGIQVDPSIPLCNGWIQGLIWVEEQMRLERVRSAGHVQREET